MPTQLTQEEIDSCRDAFLQYDKDRSGSIDQWELKEVLEAMGQTPTDEELFQMINDVDDNASGSIDFTEFLKVVEKQKERTAKFDDESDILDAFVACGGNSDKSDIEALIDEIDTDGSGEIEYEEFKVLMSG
eukprot:g652.t1